jgi:hypothetical protein
MSWQDANHSKESFSSEESEHIFDNQYNGKIQPFPFENTGFTSLIP